MTSWDKLFDKSDLAATVHADLDTLTAFGAERSVCHRAKPWVTLVVPKGFSSKVPYQARQLETVAPLLARVVPRFRVRVAFGDDPVAADSFLNVVLGSRALAREVSARHADTFLLASDPCSFNTDKWRLYWPRALREGRYETVDARRAFSGKTLALFVSPLDDLDLLQRLIGEAAPAAVTVLVNEQEWTEQAPLSERFPGAEIAPWSGHDGPRHVDAVASQTASLPMFRGDERFFWLDVDAKAGGVVAKKPLSGPLPSDDYVYKGVDLNYLKVVERATNTRSGATTTASVTAPLISIIIPVYDRTTEIERLAQSILRQDYQNLEVIFISNGSPAPTLQTLRDVKDLLTGKRIAVETLTFAQAFGSATIPRDVGVYRANGDFCCFIDSDDWLSDGFFDVMRGRCDLNTIYYPHKIFHDFGRTMRADFPWSKRLAGLGRIESGKLFAALKDNGNFFVNSGIIAPRRRCENVAGIWHKLNYCEDYYLWLTLAKAGAAACEHDGTVNIALHPNNNELKVGDDAWIRAAIERAESGVLAW